jgi:hypothetical protein
MYRLKNIKGLLDPYKYDKQTPERNMHLMPKSLRNPRLHLTINTASNTHLNNKET